MSNRYNNYDGQAVYQSARDWGESLRSTSVDTSSANPLNGQVGGGHYKDRTIQPVEYIVANNLTFLEGCIVKRISRWRVKDGVKDLLKIKHEIDLIIELEGLDVPEQT